MTDEGAVKEPERHRDEVRLITKVVISYRLKDDPTVDGTLTLANTAGGEVVDGVVWSDELMKKIAYLEGEKCREPEKKPGTGKWKAFVRQERRKDVDFGDSPLADAAEGLAELGDAALRAAARGAEILRDAALDATAESSGAEPECIWLHNIDCSWSEYCSHDT